MADITMIPSTGGGGGVAVETGSPGVQAGSGGIAIATDGPEHGGIEIEAG